MYLFCIYITYLSVNNPLFWQVWCCLDRYIITWPPKIVRTRSGCKLSTLHIHRVLGIIQWVWLWYKKERATYFQSYRRGTDKDIKVEQLVLPLLQFTVLGMLARGDAKWGAWIVVAGAFKTYCVPLFSHHLLESLILQQLTIVPHHWVKSTKSTNQIQIITSCS